MEKIISNPGLQHLVEKVFWNLDDVEDLKICAQINQSCKQILQNPIFCLRKFEHLSKENQKDWIEVIQSVKNSDKEKAIISYLQWNLKNDAFQDLPCYSRPIVQDEFWRELMEICSDDNLLEADIDIVKILAPMIDNPNVANAAGNTPIHYAASNGHAEIVKILAPLTDNPNVPNEDGETPISVAKNARIRRIIESFNSSKKRKVELPKKPSKKRAKKF